jgi:hypothetical protein
MAISISSNYFYNSFILQTYTNLGSSSSPDYGSSSSHSSSSSLKGWVLKLYQHQVQGMSMGAGYPPRSGPRLCLSA